MYNPSNLRNIIERAYRSTFFKHSSGKDVLAKREMLSQTEKREACYFGKALKCNVRARIGCTTSALGVGQFLRLDDQTVGGCHGDQYLSRESRGGRRDC